jgi:alcohol dehydrogenase class IV
MTPPFSIARTPLLEFGPGKISTLPLMIRNYGKNVLLVTGATSFTSSIDGKKIVHELQNNFQVNQYSILAEPSPSVVDGAVEQFRHKDIDVVVAIGGGSVLDAGKAISAMLPHNQPVKDFLEGVGTQNHPGTKVPFIAVPTTSGTGSEATKNAVLSEIGENGFKKSLRHNNFVPDVALLDPQLTLNTPADITAWTGMDAFTQLLEAYVSINANSFTDAIAFEGLKLVARSLDKSVKLGSDINARSDMSLAAYYSGVVLANAGLGVVHGFASPIGGYYNIPHGLICSRLMYPANKITIDRLRHDAPDNVALKKYALVGKLFARETNRNDRYYVDSLLVKIADFCSGFSIPSLPINATDVDKILADTDNKNNPVKLNREELHAVITEATSM